MHIPNQLLHLKGVLGLEPWHIQRTSIVASATNMFYDSFLDLAIDLLQHFIAVMHGDHNLICDQICSLHQIYGHYRSTEVHEHIAFPISQAQAHKWSG